MGELLLNGIVLVIFCGAMLIAYLLFMQSKNSAWSEEDESPQSSTTTITDTTVTEIFYMFNHSSNRDWCEWLKKQNTDIKQTAFDRLVNHLNNDPMYWGFATIEALNSLTVFSAEEIFGVLVDFLRRAKKHWGEYKSIPIYYSTAMNLLGHIEPKGAIEVMEEELQAKLFAKAETEKQKIIVDALTKMQDENFGVVELLFDIVTDSTEELEIRKYAIEQSTHLKRPEAVKLYQKLIEDYLELGERNELSRTENLVCEDLFDKASRYINSSDLFPSIEKFCQSEHVKKIAVSAIVDMINDDDSLNVNQLFAISQLEDSADDEIKKTISAKNALTDREKELLLEPTPSQMNEEYLSKSELVDGRLPIPEIMTPDYRGFCDLFFKNKFLDPNNPDDKIYGGLLATGIEELFKLYYTRAFALEKKWRFLYVDVKKINTKEKYDEFYHKLAKLVKPCVIYIKDPQLLYEESFAKDETVIRQKVLHALTIQSLDKKCFIAGSIKDNFDEIKDKSIAAAIDKLCAKFFPQTVELNKSDENKKLEIIQSILDKVDVEKRIKEKDFIEEVLLSSENKSLIELYFYVLRQVKTMLMVYKNIQSLKDISRLDGQLSKK
jgi:hypothetical protein